MGIDQNQHSRELISARLDVDSARTLWASFCDTEICVLIRMRSLSLHRWPWDSPVV